MNTSGFIEIQAKSATATKVARTRFFAKPCRLNRAEPKPGSWKADKPRKGSNSSLQTRHTQLIWLHHLRQKGWHGDVVPIPQYLGIRQNQLHPPFHYISDRGLTNTPQFPKLCFTNKCTSYTTLKKSFRKCIFDGNYIYNFTKSQRVICGFWFINLVLLF